MLLIPVMELKSGHSVYTQHKDDGDSLVTEDPMEAVEHWVKAGAKRIHIVDVDAIRAKQPVNAHKITEIHKRYPDLEFQIGGISREEDVLVWLDAGAKYLVMNSQAICRPGFVAEMCVEYSGSIMVALDAHDGKVRFRGHEENHDLLTLAKDFDDQGVQGILLTEIPDSGHVNACNILTSCELAANINIPVIANGGISCIADLEALEKANEHRLTGIVIGRPLHDQKLDFKTAQDCVVDL
ncbi:MAG: 1-(5-phosphoribosyl)-5-((5-phosphoribosylamino)methylideneamino)imidazole-4-carboxamide isomerase [Gammaproteobacteria bacterium]|nr:MAG: 1-(5-phosphoribosyl)-5-((5-phosphoribosylamino)methylideneamino)imidazole-4-carboxamide isomerase [Gammaproteobacteria bacterium]